QVGDRHGQVTRGGIVVPGVAEPAREIPARTFMGAVEDAEVAVDVGLVLLRVTRAIDARVAVAASEAEPRVGVDPIVDTGQGAVDVRVVAIDVGTLILRQPGAKYLTPH